MKLELHNIAFVSLNLLMIANVDLLRALADQSHIVRNHDNATFEAINTPSQSVNGFHVERVGGFVKHQQVRFLVGDNCKYNTGFLPSRKLIHSLTLHASRAPESAQQRPNRFNCLGWHEILLEKVQRGLGQI